MQAAEQRANAHLTAQAEPHTALPDPDQISAGIAPTAPPLGVSLDGATFNVRGEGWQEAKVGCVFTFAPTGPVRPTQASAMTYVFHFGLPASFGRLVWAEADRRGWLAARQTVVLGDGAAWLWNQAV